MDTSRILRDLRVYAQAPEGSDDGIRQYVGTVDKVEGDFVKLKRSDSPDGSHHWFPADWVERVDDQSIVLTKTVADFLAGIRNQPPYSKVDEAA